MAFESVVGQERARAIAEAWLRSGRIPHAILLCGPEGAGKRQFALALAGSLLCAEQGDVACGSCPSCRKAASGSHPDLHFLLPLRAKRGRKSLDPQEVRAAAQDYLSGGELGGQANIAIEQLRQMQRDMSYAPSEGGRKVAVIFAAERMHPAGANSLLKILEEPLADSLLILVSSAPERMLPTVLSRCQRLALRPLSAQVVRAELEAMRVTGPALELGVRLGGGSVQRARAVATGAWDEIRERVEQFIEAGLRCEDEVYWNTVEELAGDRSQQEQFLQLCALYLRDFFLIHHARDGLAVMVDRSAYCTQVGTALRGDHIERAMLEIERAAEALERNAGLQLVLSDLWRCLRRAGRAA